MTTSSEPTTLYRFFGTDDALLYVGITKRGRRRWYEHEDDKAWWSLVVRTTTEHYLDRPSALAAEKYAIETEHPLFNIVHNDRSRPRPSPHVVVICCKCRKAIADDEGYLEVSHVAVRQFETGRRSERAAWEAWHRSCDPDPQGSQYWIGVERIRSLDDVDRWNNHLSEKGWVLDCTNWIFVYTSAIDGVIDPDAYFADLI